jgi:hypothetical protein
MRTLKRNLVPLLACAMALLVLCGVSFADFGPSQGGTGGGGGFANPATEALDMDGNTITDGSGVLTLLANGVQFTLGDSDAASLNAPLSLNGNDLTGVGNLEVAGELTARANVVAITAGVGAPATLTEAQSGSLVTCTGTSVLSACVLPDAATVGTYYDFLVDDVTDGLRVNADTGATIDMGVWASASAGYVHSARTNSSFRCTLVATNAWEATKITGTWRKDSASVGGFAFTPDSGTLASFAHTWDGDADVSEIVYYEHTGAQVFLHGAILCAGAPTTATLTLSIPTQFPIDPARMPGAATGAAALDSSGRCDNSNVASNPVQVYWLDSTPDTFPIYTAADTSVALITQAAPFAWGAGDELFFSVRYPVTQ